MGIFNKDKSTQMSVPKAKYIHGIEVQKTPVGRYIRAMKDMEELPAVLVQQCFPGQSLDDVLHMLADADQNTMIVLLGKLLTVLPEHLVNAVCNIMDIDTEVAMNQLTPKELLDVFQAFWEMNDLSDFFASVWGILKKKLPTQNTGSKNGLRQAKASASAREA